MIKSKKTSKRREHSTWVLASAVVIWRKDRLLALKRAAKRRVAAGFWEIPSGRVQLAENPLKAAARELKEETGLIADIDPRPIDIYPAMHGKKPMMVIVYQAKYLRGKVDISAEHDESRWCSLAEFKKLCSFDSMVQAVARSQRP